MTSDTSIRYRKTPKTPFVFGNILLAALGASLVFFGPEPFSVSTVLLVVLCLAIGGVLTLIPFLLDQFSLLNVSRNRASQAAVNLRAALSRSEEILTELREKEMSENPLRLVSERLPQLVGEKLKDSLDHEFRERFAEELLNRVKEETNTLLQKAAAEQKRLQEEILAQFEQVRDYPKIVEKLSDQLQSFSAHAAKRELVQTGLEQISVEVKRLEIKLDDLRRSQLFGVPTLSEEEPSPIPAKGAAASQPSKVEESKELDSKAQKQPGKNGEGQTSPNKDESATAAVSSSEKREAESIGKKASIVVSAFVGIQNGVYLRGDHPLLSPEKGVRLEMTGIGEWIWTAEIEDSFQAELFLNDETPAETGKFTVRPGDHLILDPTFPSP
ncbi:MAG: hypothetical protein AAGJ81_02815 [Verrucomicrobiota bacterium]